MLMECVNIFRYIKFSFEGHEVNLFMMKDVQIPNKKSNFNLSKLCLCQKTNLSAND